MGPLGKIVKQLISSLQSKKAGAETLCDAFVPLLKRQKNSNQVSEILEAIEKRDHKTIWTAILRHMEVVVSELEVVEETGFDPVGSSVFKMGDGDEQIFGRIVNLIEGDEDHENTLLCAVMYDDGSEEQFPFTECKTRIVDKDGTKDMSSSSMNENKLSSGFSVESVEALNAVASFALAWISYRGPSGLTRLDAPEAMLSAVILLHDILFDLSGLDGVACQEVISRVCEGWWIDERPGAELLVPQLLPYLLVHALSEDGKQADIKRLYLMRGALLLLDFEDESIETLQGLLVRCAMHPRFIGGKQKSGNGNDFGKKFLIFLFGLHPNLVESLHATVKNQLPLASSTVLKVYGDIYLRAWRASDPAIANEPTSSSSNQAVGVYRRSIETCIQELMNVSIHAASTSMHKCCREVLSVLHEGKNVGGCDAMLYKLWEPIIFRALNVANPFVRCNAVSLLSDAFPLTPPSNASSGKSGKGKQNSAEDFASEDEVLQKQFDSMMSLLEDCDPRVRAAAATTASNILLKFWEAIPSNTSKSLLTTVTAKCAHDKTSTLVRTAAVNGITAMLEQPLCHPVLKALLPSLQYLIHDTSEKVRHAMVILLQRVSTVRAIKFFQVVSVEQLHARLAYDYEKQCLTTSHALVKLFVPSYLPDMSDSDEHERDQLHLRRCLAFLKQSPKAGLVFYSLAYGAHDRVSIDVMRNLIELLFSYAQTLSIHIDEQASQISSKKNESNKQGDEEEEGDDEDEDDDLAPPTPDKRSKRKHRNKKKNNKSSSLSSDQDNKLNEEMEKKRKLVTLCLECTCNIYESILPSINKSNALSHENECLVEKLMDVEEGIPALYRLLAQASEPNSSTRNALLRLAACLPKQHLKTLGPFLLEVLDGCVPTGCLSDLTPAVSLLCKCGSADSISTLIKESLEAELAKVASTKADSDDDKEEKGKRKRNRRKTGSSVSSSSASKDSEGAVFPYPLTLKILNSISSGSDSLCNQARLSIIQNDDAVEILLSTFNLLKKTMFDVCLTNNVIGYSSLQINMFIESIELFGRLLTHINVEESINKKKNDQDDVESKHQETCLSDDMKDLIQWAFNDLLPLTINNEEDDDVEEEKSSSSSSAPLSPVSGNKKKKKGKSKKVSDDILSPPMKAPRANGTSPVSNNAALAIAASSSSSSSMNNFVASNVACEIVAIVLSLASDWTACGMSLNFLSSAAEQCAMFLINISDMHKDDLNNGNDVNFNENMGGILSALGRFTYQLAVQETQGASCPPSALSLLLRSAHLELSSPTTSSSTSTSSSFNMLRHDNDNQEIVHGYVLQLLTLATRRGHDTLNRLVLYFIDIIIEHSMIEIPKDEEIDLDDLTTSCLTPSGQVILSILLKYKNGSKAFIFNLLEHKISKQNETTPTTTTTDDIHEMKPALLLLHSICGELRNQSVSDKNSAILLKWVLQLPSFPGNKPASPVADKVSLVPVTSK